MGIFGEVVGVDYDLPKYKEVKCTMKDYGGAFEVSSELLKPDPIINDARILATFPKDYNNA